MRTGLALAGGGVPGTTALGVIQALEEADIKITHVAGTSSGSIVAALYAYGMATDKLLAVVPRLNRRYLDIDWRSIFLKLVLYRPYLDGWLKGKRLFDLVAELTESSFLSEMKIPCGIIATDLSSGRPIIFAKQPIDGYTTESEISIAEAVRASISIPVLFQPMRWKDYVLVDGGVTMNCPVQVVRAMGAERVISVDPVTPFVKQKNPLTSALSIFNYAINLNLQYQMQQEHSYADLTLFPMVGPVSSFDFRKVQQCITAGYRHAKEKLDEIKNVLSQ
ncbi:hypothetical protein PAE9249_00681 [Paenibacillus sp. CECT 9249]|uniref:patatin-like phospholipase family protein n=1 Tax=Paenibacillus sp. CECT 9249 TaxID=2845385 RepID=UPI001E520CA1|nr:patatin-like phospholipase family protein [Paenibacillus sp. CECT 9249]CAH0118214.1 hypothetical protein PAE9249_00681 [Paenibacillus sp. CECT 9249]